MRRLLMVILFAGLVCLLPGCGFDKPVTKVGPEADLSKVLSKLREDLNDSLVSRDASKTGLGVSKLTAVLKVTSVDTATGKLTFGIVQPVGGLEVSGSSQGSLENTITVEFAPDAAPAPKTALSGTSPPLPGRGLPVRDDKRYLDGTLKGGTLDPCKVNPDQPCRQPPKKNR